MDKNIHYWRRRRAAVRTGPHTPAWTGSLAAAAIVLAGGLAISSAQPPVNSTLQDFYYPGSQDGEVEEPLVEVLECRTCHGDFDPPHEPMRNWAASMMGQGARDPIFWAALAVAEQSAPFVGDFCIRCHVPRGWIEGRSQPTSGAGLFEDDLEGISCSVCHRMVDPVYDPVASPPPDAKILASLAALPVGFHSAQFVVDPTDRRRGPFNLSRAFHWHEWERSPFHREPEMCGTCHDVSNPLLTMQPDGRYVLNQLNAPHPTHQAYDAFPLERTYSEWKQSEFAHGPVDLGGRFGGNRGPAVSSCQDCHMPTVTASACNPVFGGPVRPDMPQHDFRGATTWMLQAVRNLYPDVLTGLTAESVGEAVDRNQEMMRRASDLFLSVVDGQLQVRIVNQSGHKLPTGHLEGRRCWINIRFFDAPGVLLAEHGAYNPVTAVLEPGATKVYEAVVGLDEPMAALLGEPPGPSHHFPLNNKFYKDNRIPPRGFTNAGFAAIQSAPVEASFVDGQFWDDTYFPIPAGAARAEAAFYYQTITREGVEGLRDANHTNNAGEILYQQWLATGKSPPVQMDHEILVLADYCRGDFNEDGVLSLTDFNAFQAAFTARDPRTDFNADGRMTVADFGAFQTAFVVGCP